MFFSILSMSHGGFLSFNFIYILTNTCNVWWCIIWPHLKIMLFIVWSVRLIIFKLRNLGLIGLTTTPGEWAGTSFFKTELDTIHSLFSLFGFLLLWRRTLMGFMQKPVAPMWLSSMVPCGRPAVVIAKRWRRTGTCRSVKLSMERYLCTYDSTVSLEWSERWYSIFLIERERFLINWPSWFCYFWFICPWVSNLLPFTRL